ncbi:MAG: hypothetical protein QNJ09_16000 [Paracoccaceae bacterium]|nr:hypothetical protein [Paracoccaceae bacterium]
MRSFSYHPDSCPSCDSAPYPHDVACGRCGFVGAPRDTAYQAIEDIGRYAVWLPVLGLILVTVFLVGLL